ncbi:PREDICTED: LOB domain-containing protein 20-like [Ipomoea nil]|uniref:LOB domain-containing protein 20-like n=1 Tax=Ipomoea nil TaxID=35883 RepID=UPI0009016054|nr:PREDICTED: LOB domain-containing protein 20-like [Ipomoea nil]
MASGVSSPCGACKFLRWRCVPECVFASYFCFDHGSTIFATVHKVFDTSNVSKLLLQLPVHQRFAAIFSITYETQARMKTPSMAASPTSLLCNNRYHGLEPGSGSDGSKSSACAVLANSMNAGTPMVGGPPVPFPATDQNATNPYYSVDHFNDGRFWPPEMYTGEEVVLFPAEN